MIINKKYYFFSKKIFLTTSKDDFLAEKNKFVLNIKPHYLELSLQEQWLVVTDALKTLWPKEKLPDFQIEKLSPNPPNRTIVEQVTNLRKNLVQSRAEENYFKQLIEFVEQVWFLISTDNPIYRLSSNQKNKLYEDVNKLIIINPDGKEGIIQFYLLMHKYRNHNDWMPRVLEKYRLEVILKLTKDYSSHYSLDNHMRMMRLSTRHGFWEHYEMSEKDTLSPFIFQVYENYFKNNLQKYYGMYLNHAIEYLTDECIQQFEEQILGAFKKTGLSCFIYPSPMQAFLWSNEKIEISMDDFQVCSEIFTRLFGKDCYQKYFAQIIEQGHKDILLNPKNKVRALFYQLIEQKFLQERYLISFDELLETPSLESQIVFLGEYHFDFYRNFYVNLHSKKQVTQKFHEKDESFIRFCGFNLEHYRHYIIHVTDVGVKKIIEKIVLEAIDAALHTHNVLTLEKMTSLFIQLKTHAHQDLFNLSSRYYENPVIMRRLVSYDAFLAFKSPQYSKDYFAQGKQCFPEMRDLFEEEHFHQGDINCSRKELFLEILIKEDDISKELFERHVFLLDMNDIQRIIHIRQLNALKPLPGLDYPYVLIYLKHFQAIELGYSQNQYSLPNVRFYHNLYEQQEDWYHRFMAWYQHQSYFIGGQLIFSSLILNSLYFLWRLFMISYYLIVQAGLGAFYCLCLYAEKFFPDEIQFSDKIGYLMGMGDKFLNWIDNFLKHVLKPIDAELAQYIKPVYAVGKELKDQYSAYFVKNML